MQRLGDNHQPNGIDVAGSTDTQVRYTDAVNRALAALDDATAARHEAAAFRGTATAMPFPAVLEAAVPCEAAHLLPFASASVPPIPLVDYAARIRYFTGADADEVAHALALALRAAHDSPANITPLVAHRLLGTAFIVTLKLTRDWSPLPRADLCAVVGLAPSEAAQLELELLQALDFRAHVDLADCLSACGVLAASGPRLAAFDSLSSVCSSASAASDTPAETYLVPTAAQSTLCAA